MWLIVVFVLDEHTALTSSHPVPLTTSCCSSKCGEEGRSEGWWMIRKHNQDKCPQIWFLLLCYLIIVDLIMVYAPLFPFVFLCQNAHTERDHTHAHSITPSLTDVKRKEMLRAVSWWPVQCFLFLWPSLHTLISLFAVKKKKKILTYLNEPFMFFVWTWVTHKGWLVFFCSCKSFASGLRSQPRARVVAKHQPFNLSSDVTQAVGRCPCLVNGVGLPSAGKKLEHAHGLLAFIFCIVFRAGPSHKRTKRPKSN